MRDSLFCAFPGLAPSIHLNIKAMFVFVERIQKPDIQADSNEQRFFSTKLIFYKYISFGQCNKNQSEDYQNFNKWEKTHAVMTVCTLFFPVLDDWLL
jgi:hypothetical protein